MQKSQAARAAKSILIIIAFTIGSKLLGFIREMLIAAKFGSGSVADSFFVALTATGLFTAMFTEALGVSMIPVISDVERKEGRAGKLRHVNNLFNAVIILTLAAVALGWFFAPVIIKLLANGFKGEQLIRTVSLMRIGLPVVVIAGILGVYKGFLKSELRFTEGAAAQFPYNLVYIFFLIFLSGFFGIKGLMVTGVLATGSQILILRRGIVKAGLSYAPIIDFKSSYLRRMLYLAIPIFISVSVNDLNKIVDSALASGLLEGSISALNYSGRLNGMILEIFISAISTVFFPLLSKEAAEGSYEKLKNLLRRGVNVILLITIPATLGMIILAKPLVRLIFERGAFDALATQMASEALIFYSLGLIAMALRSFLDVVYYSLSDTKRPMINGFATVLLNIALNLILVRVMLHSGLALATSLATTLTTAYLFYGLRKKLGYLKGSSVFKAAIKSVVSSVVMGLWIYYAYFFFEAAVLGSRIKELMLLIFTALVAFFIYILMIYILKVEEMSFLLGLLRKRIKRFKEKEEKA